MAEQFANKIKRLELENFTCFGKVAMDFSPGINVIIGENGTGKTHLLKVLYAALQNTKYFFTVTNQSKGFNSEDAKREFWAHLKEGLENVFKTETLDNLKRDADNGFTN
ncbi:MAG: AAA family ATPase [Saprospiraceae bacterium]|nr:AAA family ATPase [Saprospiraceae bacterium]